MTRSPKNANATSKTTSDNKGPSTRAIAAFALGTLFFAYAFTQRVAPSVMTTELMRDFAVGGAALGGLSAWYFYTYALIQMPVGLLTDRFGPRKLMSAAMLLCCVVTLGFAWSETLLTASVARALVGATVGFGFVGTLAIAGYWFPPARFAMLAGVLQAAGMCGGMLGQAPVRLAVEQIGWRGTMVVMAVVAALLSVLLYLVIPRRPVRHAGADKSVGETAITPRNNGFAAVVSNPQSWLCAATAFGISSVMLGFVGLWAIPWLTTTRNLARPEAAAIASALFLGWAIGAPIVGWLSDYICRRKPIIVIGLVGNVVFFSAIVLAGVTDKVLLSILFFTAGMFGSGMTILFGVMREVNAPASSATALGLLNMCLVGSGAVTQPLVGWFLDRNWAGVMQDGARIYSSANYQSAFVVFWTANLIALLAVLFIRETRCRQVA